MSEDMCDSMASMARHPSPTDNRHQLMSRWHSPTTRQLCRDRLLSRLKQSQEMRSSLVDRMRKIDINNDTADDGDEDNAYVDEEIQHMMNTDVDMMSMSAQELHQLTNEVRQEFLNEQSKSWEGLQTKEDQRKSQQFVNSLQVHRVIPCPYCKTHAMEKTASAYLMCPSCAIRFETDLTVEQIIARMFEVLNYHSMSECTDRFPQFNMFNTNLIIYCDTCPLNQTIL
ncbi:unnamed protein product [Medioppia subpectinata]|uniref:RPA-interacting protein C-terminal domain-containing protein n=1 Tax=Medioppia subpectinata TaxID=1979941 RepID=A0A7R9L4E9_9ACAR|nr:unnamed protein product [Medioppia subpectinata]CAG2114171.1 unnamed protein product [Medioppia subpectinata]